MSEWREQVAARAARWVVDEALGYAQAKQRAVRELGLSRAHPLPDNREVELAVLEHLALFHGDTQPGELVALRQIALRWMERLSTFRPHLTGPVWSGTATRLNAVTLQLFCDDPKSAEFQILDMGVRYEASTHTGFRGEDISALSICEFNRDMNGEVMVHLLVYDHDDLRGALRPDAHGRVARGNAHALRRLMGQTPDQTPSE